MDDAAEHPEEPDEGSQASDEEGEDYRVDDDAQQPEVLRSDLPSPPFAVVADLLEECSQATARKVGITKAADRRRSMIENFFELYRKRVGKDLFPVVRLLVPDRDRQRSTYGCKEGKLAKLYIEALGLDHHISYDANRLLKWKEPAPGEVGAGDFAEIAYSLIQSRSALIGQKGRFTVEQVNRLLDDLSRLPPPQKGSVISQFFRNCTPEEQKWIIRIILKDLKISIRERTVLQILHPEAVALFNVCSDLRRVCWTLYDDDCHLDREDSSVQLWHTFRPMLCKRNEKSIESIVKVMMKDNPEKFFYIEEKLDGERIQLHMRGGGSYRYSSRNDKDYTYLYGKSPYDTNGCLTQHIHDCIRGVDQVVLDGEMMVFDPVTSRFMQFGYLKNAALDKSANENKPRACFKVFDILYFRTKGHEKGNQLLDWPLIKRREFLKKIVHEKHGYIEYDQCMPAKTAVDIRDSLERILDNCGEGLVIKHPFSRYILDGREDTWFKIKPDYMDALGETFDCVCIGGFWGSGKRGGNFGSFIVGVLDSRTNDFLSFCKVGSGLSLSHLKELDKYCAGKWKDMPRNRSQNPPGLKFRKERPDVYINPEDSFVITIKAAEILVDPEGMESGLCLRFPRIERIHVGENHKDPFQQLTYADLVERKNAIGTSKRRVTSDNLDRGKKVKVAKVVARNKFAADVNFDTAKNGTESFIFSGITFWVINGVLTHDKAALQKLVHTNGGELAQTIPRDTPRRIISRGADFMQAKQIIEKGHNLISPNWIVDCVERGSRLPLTNYYVHQADDPSIDGHDIPEVAEIENVDEEDIAKRIRIRESPDTADEDEPADTGLRDQAEAERAAEIAERSWNEAEPPDGAGGTDTEEDGDRGRIQHYIAEPAGPGLAADEPDERDYDPENIFKHLVFYLDTKEGAARNGLPNSTALALNHPTFTQIANYIKQSGGTITENIYDKKTTHIVFAQKDTSRQQKLRRSSSENGGREKRLITTAWIVDSFQDDTLLNETDYAPR